MRSITAVFFIALLASSALSTCVVQGSDCTGCGKNAKCLVVGTHCRCVAASSGLLSRRSSSAPLSLIRTDQGDCKQYDEPCKANEECCSLYCKKETGKCFFF